MRRNKIVLFMPLGGGDAYRCVPYALLYLERVVRDMSVELIIVDENIGDDFRAVIDKEKAQILMVGVSAMLGYQIHGGIVFSQYVRAADKDIKIVWGGWHVSMVPEQSLSESYIDYVISGQGEMPFSLLTEALLKETGINHIKGLYYKENGAVKNGGDNDFVSTTNFPAVDYSLIDLNKYILRGIPYAQRTVVYFASHGCPHNCSFCALTPVYKQRWFPKPVDDVVKDLQYFKKTANIDSICFHDDNFFTNKTYTLSLAQAMIDANLNLKWEVWSHAGSFMKTYDEAELDFFYKAGCRRILCGAESGSSIVLKHLNKKLSAEENIQFVKMLKRHNITPYFTTMICFPMNPDEDINATFEMIRKAKLADLSLKVHVGYYTPFPHTDLYKEALSHGFVPPENLEGWINHTFETFRAPWFKAEYEERYNIFLNFYVTLSNPFFFNNASRPLKQKVFLGMINFIVFPFAYLRLRFNYFKYPIGAYLFFYLMALYNKKTGNRFMIYPH